MGGTQLSAQTATISGSVTDASGASVPDAAVQVKNTGTGASRTVNSDAEGRYRIPQLPIGAYDAQASKAGFQTVNRTNITLNVGTELVVDFALPVGQQTTSVSVEGQIASVETTTAAVGVVTDSRQMRELPLNGRNFEQLILLAPGVNQVSNFTSSGFQGRAAQYSIAGARPTGQAILMDNESLQNFWNKGMGSVTGSSLGVEAIAEFQTLTNTYGAEFGGNGSVINSVSRSGTNDLHGSAYEFLRNNAFDAWNALAKVPTTPNQPAYRQNQFGGAIGGPIQKDKLFFFGNYEGIRRTLGVVKTPQVPNCKGDYSTPGGICTPSASLPLATQNAIINVLRLYPSPSTATTGSVGTSVQVGNQAAKEHYGLGRVDYNLSNNDALFFRSVTDKTEFADPFGGGGFGGAGGGIQLWPEGDASGAQFTTLQWRRIVSPTIVNSARISFSRNTTTAETIGSTSALQQFFPGAGRQDGQVTFAGTIAGIGGATQLPFNETQNRWTEGDDVTWTKGAQTIKFGVAVSRLQTNTYMPFRIGSIWAFQGLAGFLGGVPTSVTWVPENIPAGLPAGPGPTYANRDFRHTELLPYFQDDWKISSKLTLNLGVRYSWTTNPVENHNQLYQITNWLTSTNFEKVTNVMASNPNKWNFDPRVGIAFDPFSDHKTSIRAGFGMFHQLILPPDYAPAIWNHPPWSTFQTGSQFGNNNVQFPNVPTSAAAALPTSSPAFDWGSVTTTPYNMQYNLTVQREILPATILSIGYVGSRGVHQLTQVERNLLKIGASGTTVNTANGNSGFNAANSAVVTYGRNNANLGSFPAFVPTTTSRYNSLQVNVTRRFQNHFQAQLSYTRGRCEDNGSYVGSFNNNVNAASSNPYDQNYDKSVCNYDIANQLRINGVWALPFKGNRIVSGWQLSGIVSSSSGLPFTVLQGVDTLGWTNGVVNPRPNLLNTNPTIGTSTAAWFNRSDFQVAGAGAYGSSPRLGFRGPGLNNADISVIKDTKVTERINMQFRAEFFNILNHVNWAGPNTGDQNTTLYTGFTTATTANGLPTVPVPGAIVSANGAPTQLNVAQNPNAGKLLSLVGLSPARNIQFALKLTF